MHFSTLIALSLPFLPSILSHPVVDGAEAPSRVHQRRQYDTLLSGATGTGGILPSNTGDPFPSSTGTGSLGQMGTTKGNTGSFKMMDSGGLLAACASASLGSPSSTASITPLDTTESLSTTTDGDDTDCSTDLTGSTTATSAGLTSPTGTTEKRQVGKRQAWHTHMAKMSPLDFATLCSMVEKYSLMSTTGTQKSSTTNTGDDTADAGDTTGGFTATTDPTGPTGTASATLPTSTTDSSSLLDKKMKRANGW